MAYIYKIVNKTNNKLYIGKTSSTIEERFQEHCRDSKKVRCEKRPLYDAMNKYGIEQFYIEMIEQVSNDEIASQREKYWIQTLRTYIGFEDCNGYNATLGGDGTQYKHYDEQEIIKYYFSEDRISLEKVAKKFNLDRSYIADIIKRNGYKIKDRIVTRGRKVCQLDVQTNEIINIFNSIKEAKAYFNVTSGTINDALSGRRKTRMAYNYKWCYLEEIE